jgi:hypothetical protein
VIGSNRCGHSFDGRRAFVWKMVESFARRPKTGRDLRIVRADPRSWDSWARGWSGQAAQHDAGKAGLRAAHEEQL